MLLGNMYGSAWINN